MNNSKWSYIRGPRTVSSVQQEYKKNLRINMEFYNPRRGKPAFVTPNNEASLCGVYSVFSRSLSKL